MAAPADASTAALDRLVERAFAALDGVGATWCVLRGESSLHRPRNDIDLLVDPIGLAAAATPLAKAGFAPLPLRSRHRLFAAYAPADDHWVKLDVVTELAYGRPPTFRPPAAAACLERRVRVQGVPLLELEDRFWTELLHVVLDREEVPAGARARLATLSEQIDPGRGPLAAHLRELLGADAPERLAGLAARGEWSSLRSSIAGAVPRGEAPGRRPRAGAIRRLRSRAGRTGVSIALLGPDGAGKSTLAAGLRDSVPLGTRCYYMGLQAGASIPGKTWKGPAASGPRRRKPLPVRLVRQWRRLLRLARRSATAWVSMRTGHLVIFDRYPYDAEVHWADPTRPGARMRLWLLRRAVRRPDVVLLLDVPGEITFERKCEHSPELLEERRQRYLALAGRLERAHVVDGTLPADEVRATVTELVWSAYTRKHEQRRALRRS